MEEREYKRQFAGYLLRKPDDPYWAALQVYPDDTQLAAMIARTWPIDGEVLRLKKELVEANGADHYLPQRDELARSLWARMHDKNVTPDEFAKLAKVYADVMGMVQKNVNVKSVDSFADAFRDIAERLPG